MAGLRRLVGAAGGWPAAPRGGTVRLALLAGPRAAAAARGLRAWLSGRAVPPIPSSASLSGLSLLLALCAAGWFSGGTAGDWLAGIAALAGSLLARAGTGRRPPAPHRAATPPRAGRARHQDPASAPGAGAVFTDWLVLPGLAWPGASGAGPGAAGPAPARDAASPAPPGVAEPEAAGPGEGREGAGPGEGREAARLGDAGPQGAGLGEAGPGVPTSAPPGWLAGACATAGECAIYGGIAAGGQAAGWPGMWPLAVGALVAAAVADAVAACGQVRVPGGLSRMAPGGSPAWHRIGLALAVPPWARLALAAAGLAVSGPRLALVLVLAAGMGSVPVVVTGVARRAVAGRPPPAQPDAIRACRDDGALARWAGRLVQGRIAPLAPAVAGASAAILVDSLGLRTALGLLALAPLVVMLLAAPGSGHPHDGRLDWLAPACLVLGESVYLATLGFAWAVPGPAVFGLCAMTMTWRALAGGGPPGRQARGIGWEARMFVAGAAATSGIAVIGYVGLAAYLAVLAGREVLARGWRPGEATR